MSAIKWFDRQVRISVEHGERWWGGTASDGRWMPFGEEPFTRDLGEPVRQGVDEGAPSNQSSPLLLSTTGRVVWSDRPFRFEFSGESLVVDGHDIQLHRAGDTLRDAFLFASRRYFPPSGRTPAEELFAGPQYNTWIEMPYQPTQEAVLSYVRGLLDAGFPPGVIIIDDSWAPDYGTWRFDDSRFPDPAEMVDQLHDWGCSVMLWLVPFVSPDSAAFRELEHKRMLIRDSSGRSAVRRWWNGYSALLDPTNPETVAWLTTQLDSLVDEIGVDGFKFDGGDVRDYRVDDQTAGRADPVELCQAWAAVGVRYHFNEFRACWRMGGQPLGQRLQDKPPAWGADGIGSIIPEMLAQGLIGHPFTCPDMIGGGEIEAMTDQGTVDQEFFVRYAQIAVFSPMAQFSVSPSRVLDSDHLRAVKAALALRADITPTILRLVEEAAISGEPVVRPMSYHAKNADDVVDQFFLGPNLIVAPVITKGVRSRSVVLPEGIWRGANGNLLRGPAVVDVEVDLCSIPRFVRVTD